MVRIDRIHHRFNGYDFEQTLGDSRRQKSLACDQYSMRSQRVGFDLVTEHHHHHHRD